MCEDEPAREVDAHSETQLVHCRHQSVRDVLKRFKVEAGRQREREGEREGERQANRQREKEKVLVRDVSFVRAPV